MRRLVGMTLAVLVVAAGCSATVPATTPSTSKSSAPTTATEGLLERNGLAGKDVREIITVLEASQTDREEGPFGSVRPDQLLLTDEVGELSLPIPSDSFYLSIAPYRETNHDCFNHNLATCQGELIDQQVSVRVVDEAGAVVLEEQLTTGANGFAGMWLPRDLVGSLTVTHQGDTATLPISTGLEDPTCLTTLKLS